MPDAGGRPSRAAAPGSWTGPFRQEIPFHFQLADLLVEPGDEDRIGFLALFVVAAEDAGRSCQQGFLPRLDLARMDFVPGCQLGYSLSPLYRFQGNPALK